MELIIKISTEMFDTFKKHGIMAFDNLDEYDRDMIADAIANGTPYNPSGDCISREALIKTVEKEEGISWDSHGKDDLCVRKKYIDNAPTVEYTFEEAFKKTVCEQRLYCPQRPQGEWIPKRLWDNTHIWVCSECGNQNKHGITVEKACWKCGAKMKGGAE